MVDLFETESATAVIGFPNRLGKLVEQFPPDARYTAPMFIANHSLLPLFSPFLPIERVEELKISMISDRDGMGIAMKVGAMASKFPMRSFLRYCPICLQYDKEHYGEMYWHRSHQIAGINVCYKHNAYLIRAEQNDLIGFNKQYFQTPSDMLSKNTLLTGSLDLQIMLAKQVHWLLNNQIQSFGLNRIHGKYATLLQENGYLTVKGTVKINDLVNAFVRTYGEEFLANLYSNFDCTCQDTWLHKLVRTPRNAQHPIRHLLFMHFLGITPEQFFEHEIVSAHPFGEGPWPCLNAGALHFKEEIILDCVITRDYKSNVPVGTFRCDCGFVYSRRGPDHSSIDRFKIGRIKAFGPIWQNALREKRDDPTRSLRSIARSMKVDVGTVKKYLHHDVKDYSPASMKKNLDEKVRDQYRTEWLRLIVEYPDLSVTRIRKLAPNVYTKLYRFDRAWLLQNKTKFILERPCLHRVNWSVRDQEVLVKIIRTKETIALKQETPMRLTISSIGKWSGTLSLLQKHLDKLPKTAEYLNGILETVEQFQIRRIQNVAKQIHQSNEEVLPWKIMRSAGIRSTASVNVRSAIAIEVNRYTNCTWVKIENENSNERLAVQKG